MPEQLLFNVEKCPLEGFEGTILTPWRDRQMGAGGGDSSRDTAAAPRLLLQWQWSAPAIFPVQTLRHHVITTCITRVV